MTQARFSLLLGTFGASLMLLLTSCQGKEDVIESGDVDTTDGDPASQTYDIDANGIPRFARADYVALEHIRRISRFRSGVGHDYSDDFESCRSMKHYFQPKTDVDWSAVRIFAPVSGTVTVAEEGWAGAQVHIKPHEYPAFVVIIFHVNTGNALRVGDVVAAGQPLGTHIGSQTMSDVAIGVSTPGGWRLVSYYEVMTDSVFQAHRARGLSSRNAAIISKAARDSAPLVCSGETFADDGNLENWITLN
jgi:hypothetical protein